MSPRLKVYSTMRARGCAQSARVVSWSQEPSVLLPLERPRGKAARHIPEMQKSWGEFHRWKGWRSGHKHLHKHLCYVHRKKEVNAVNLTTTRRQSGWEHSGKLRVNSLCATHSFGSDRLPMLDTHLHHRSLRCCPPLLLRFPARPMAPFGPVWETSPGSPAAGKTAATYKLTLWATLSASSAAIAPPRSAAWGDTGVLHRITASETFSLEEHPKELGIFVDPEMLMHIIIC